MIQEILAGGLLRQWVIILLLLMIPVNSSIKNECS